MHFPDPDTSLTNIGPPLNVLQELRAATGSLHAKLDAGLAIGRHQAVLADYVSHLQTLRPWLMKSQAMLHATNTGSLRASADRIGERLRKLDADLEDAGEASRLDTLPEPGTQKNFTAPVSSAYGWGRAYVVEGSALGGRVLFKRLQARLAPHPLRYLAGDAVTSPGAAWSDFTAQLASQLVTQAQMVQAQQGAIAAFSELLNSFVQDARHAVD
ncbi:MULTISPECIES: biliverdin-producing heme oxygenase [unclassified Variovorax]|uniref:biliverdin-producing heme oxygenase n=1 Tax=unclassified Variovorax TaxID=663243 RepID=UPI003F4660D7